MTAEDICFLPATEVALRIASRELSAVEVTDVFLSEIDARNTQTNAYITVLHEDARDRAQWAEQKVLAGGPLGPLHGVPVAIKDLFDYKVGVRNTFGSRAFATFVPKTSSLYVERLEAAGAIVLGKTNVPEFGHKGTTDNALLGASSTPFGEGKNSGGSSGGSAAAVAAGLAPLAQGTDGGGSVRIPASLCGVYGLKPSFGRVADISRPNAFLPGTPFVLVGPLARNVGDAALMLDVMAGPHSRDPYSLPATDAPFSVAVGRSIEGYRIALITELGDFPVDPEVAAIVAAAADDFRRAGATVESIRLPLAHSQEELCNLWMREMGVLYAEAMRGFTTHGLPRDIFDRRRDDFTSDFQNLIDLGRSLSALEYKADDVIRTSVFDSVADVLEQFDMLITPTLAVASVDNATDGSTVGPSSVNGVKVNALLGWCLTYVFNYTGHPAASIPAGLTSGGFPVGLQLVGQRFADADVIAASSALEQIRPWSEWYDLPRVRGNFG